MDKEQMVIAQVMRQGLLPLFYHDSLAICTATVQALYEAGIRNLEFTCRGPAALQNFKSLVQKRDMDWPGLLLGAGTIKERNSAVSFLDAGADFLVSPFFDNGVCDAAYLNKIPWIPGCMTPTEIHIAVQSGCTLIKLFPGNTLAPGFVPAIRPVFPEIDFLVTGGVEGTAESMASWFAAGVCAIGMGSKLIKKELLEKGDFEQLKADTINILRIIQSLKP